MDVVEGYRVFMAKDGGASRRIAIRSTVAGARSVVRNTLTSYTAAKSPIVLTFAVTDVTGAAVKIEEI